MQVFLTTCNFKHNLIITDLKIYIYIKPLSNLKTDICLRDARLLISYYKPVSFVPCYFIALEDEVTGGKSFALFPHDTHFHKYVWQLPNSQSLTLVHSWYL